MQRIIIYVVLIWIIGFAAPLAAQEDSGRLEITAPATGDTLFGLIEIIGTATHPNFDRYVLEWRNAQNADIWLPIQQPISQQVTEGILGQWDTVGGAVPDGVYQIRIRMFLQDGTVESVDITNLRVANATPTEIPTPIPPLQAPTIDPASGESAPIIEQPPTAIPDSSPTSIPLAEVDPPASTTTSEDAIFNFDAAGSAFCNGIFFSVGFFVLVVMYLLVRRQLSPFTRRIWYQIRSELDEDR